MEFHVHPNEIPPVKDAESAYFDFEELQKFTDRHGRQVSSLMPQVTEK